MNPRRLAILEQQAVERGEALSVTKAKIRFNYFDLTLSRFTFSEINELWEKSKPKKFLKIEEESDNLFKTIEITFENRIDFYKWIENVHPEIRRFVSMKQVYPKTTERK